LTVLLRRPRAGRVAEASVRRDCRVAPLRPPSGVPARGDHAGGAARALRGGVGRPPCADVRGLGARVQPA
jgi:hypothetical protein